MNERIKELIEKASVRGEVYLPGHDGHPSPTFYFDKEKFAELIVRECGILADQYQFEKKNPNPLATERLPLLPSDFIYEHFGVEE